MQQTQCGLAGRQVHGEGQHYEKICAHCLRAKVCETFRIRAQAAGQFRGTWLRANPKRIENSV